MHYFLILFGPAYYCAFLNQNKIRVFLFYFKIYLNFRLIWFLIVVFDFSNWIYKFPSNSFLICKGFKLPIFRPDVDYEYLYMRLFQDNEKKLQQYDTLIQEKERLLKIYKVMKTGELH